VVHSNLWKSTPKSSEAKESSIAFVAIFAFKQHRLVFLSVIGLTLQLTYEAAIFFFFIPLLSVINDFSFVILFCLSNTHTIQPIVFSCQSFLRHFFCFKASQQFFLYSKAQTPGKTAKTTTTTSASTTASPAPKQERLWVIFANSLRRSLRRCSCLPQLD
jgi:hypothetical protein